MLNEYPTPWRFTDNQEDYEGELLVIAANGDTVYYGGDMETCTWVDIQLTKAIAALPDLIALAQAIAAKYEDAADWKDARSWLLPMAENALEKAGLC